MSESVSEQNIDEILKTLGYNDSPLRRELKQAFAKWLQQKLEKLPITEFIRESKLIDELLEELEQ